MGKGTFNEWIKKRNAKVTPETEVSRVLNQNPILSVRQEADRKGRLSRAAPLLLEALNIALLEMEYVNRPQSRIAREKARRAILKATGRAP